VHRLLPLSVCHHCPRTRWDMRTAARGGRRSGAPRIRGASVSWRPACSRRRLSPRGAPRSRKQSPASTSTHERPYRFGRLVQRPKWRGGGFTSIPPKTHLRRGPSYNALINGSLAVLGAFAFHRLGQSEKVGDRRSRAELLGALSSETGCEGFDKLCGFAVCRRR
jgi:hypothetical protein